MRNRTLSIDRFELLKIPLPAVDEQRSVANRLGRLEAVAAELHRHSKHASTVAEALAVSLAARPDLDDEHKEARLWRRVRLGSAMQPASRARSAGWSLGRWTWRRSTVSW
jgi:hypothetical protein